MRSRCSCCCRLRYWKTERNAVKNTLFNCASRKFFAEHSTAPWKLNFLAASIISSLLMKAFGLTLDEPSVLISSWLRCSASYRRSDFVPTRMQGADCAQLLISFSHFDVAFLNELRSFVA